MSALRDFWTNVIGTSPPARTDDAPDDAGAGTSVSDDPPDPQPTLQGVTSPFPPAPDDEDDDDDVPAPPVVTAEAGPALGEVDAADDDPDAGDNAAVEHWEGSRGLTAAERASAQSVYQDAIDYDKVTIVGGSLVATGATRTVGNSIYFEAEYFDGNTSNLTPAGMNTLIHELGHVWQFQHEGAGYIPSALGSQLAAVVTTGDRNNAYDWQKAIDEGLPWEKWNAEQQAEAMEAYYEAKQRIDAGNSDPGDTQTVAELEPYVGKVRSGQGAPKMPPIGRPFMPLKDDDE
jgi:hypothetical protein